jgi:hypothetical protein
VLHHGNNYCLRLERPTDSGHRWWNFYCGWNTGEYGDSDEVQVCPHPFDHPSKCRGDGTCNTGSGLHYLHHSDKLRRVDLGWKSSFEWIVCLDCMGIRRLKRPSPTHDDFSPWVFTRASRSQGEQQMGKMVSCIVEFDGTGKTTGNVSLDGKEYTAFPSGLLQGPNIDGKTTTKYNLLFQADVPAGQTSQQTTAQAYTIHNHLPAAKGKQVAVTSHT